MKGWAKPLLHYYITELLNAPNVFLATMEADKQTSNSENHVVCNLMHIAISPSSWTENLLWKIQFQIVVYDSQIFDFTEELVHFLEGRMKEIDAVGSFFVFVVPC